VRDGLTANLDADIEDLGDCYVRGIPEPVRAYRVGPPARSRWWTTRASTISRHRSPSCRSLRAVRRPTRA
jgi:hypothetical protein